MAQGCVLAIFMTAVSLVAGVHARTLHVASDGDNGNTGTAELPLRTIQKAAEIARAGDTVLVRGGVYRGHVFLRFSGEPDKPIVFRNVPGERPVVDGEGKGRIELQSEHGWQKPIGWVTVEGFEVRNGWDGIKFYNAHHIVLKDNFIHDNANQGILGNGHHVRIEGNVIAHNGFKRDNETSNLEHGIYATGTDFEIVNNIIHSNRAYGIQVAGYPFRPDHHAGPEFADARRWRISHNTIAFQQNRAGIVIWQQNATDCIIEDNILYRNAVTLGRGDCQGIDFVGAGGGHIIRNNLFFGPERTSIAGNTRDYTASGNLEDKDPLFVDAEHFDFRLRRDSPAAGLGAVQDTIPAGPPVKAFPTAEGFGANAVGGRGGRVIEVTNLNDSGEGSLRSAMEASGPRICVFRVSGTITLRSAIRVSEPYLTVAGQTSPGGVQIRGSGEPEGDWGVWFVNGAHDIILRHLRVRMGGNMKHDAGNNILLYGTAEPGVHDVIVDHCSVSWGSDTQLDWYGSYLDRATFQWNIVGECFMGQHIGGNRAPKNITLHHNLYANLGSRTPLMQHADVFDFRNNVIYNWSGNNASVFGQFALNTSAFGNVVNNLWLAGPESGYPYLNVGNGGPVRIDGSPADEGGTRLYLSGNWGPRCPTGCTNDWVGQGVNTWDYYELNHDGSTHLVDEAQYSAGQPFSAPPVTVDPVSNLLDKVLLRVGAYKPSRDVIDQRIVASVRDKTGTSRGSTTGPWPDLARGAPAPAADSDHDGMPDAWEKTRGLDPDDARDGPAIGPNGYTNVENYLNELAGDSIS